MIRDFSRLIEHLRESHLRRRLVAVWAKDTTSQGAIAKALECGFVSAVFVGCRHEVETNEALMAYADHISVVDAADADEAAHIAVGIIARGEGDILMKGLINTDNLLRAVLDKERGIRIPGSVLTHITASEIPSYPKILFFSDVAVIPYPTPEQRYMQVVQLARIARSLGVEEPRIALIHCSEKVDTKHFPFTEQYPMLAQAARDGEFGPCIVDGPMDVKTACCHEAMLKKGLTSPIDGEADALIFPDIEAGNVFYKTLTLFGSATTAGLIVGARAPIVLPSRGDSIESKFHSIAFAAISS